MEVTFFHFQFMERTGELARRLKAQLQGTSGKRWGRSKIRVGRVGGEGGNETMHSQGAASIVQLRFVSRARSYIFAVAATIPISRVYTRT